MTKPQGGIVTRPSNQHRRIAAAIAPSIKAAGRRMSSKPATQTTDAPRSAAHWRGWGVWRSVKSDILSSVAKGEGVGICYSGDPRKDMPHRCLVGFRAHARGEIARDHKLVAKLPRLSRGCFDPDMRGDAAKDDRAHAATSKLGIEVGAEDRAPGRLGDENVAGVGKARREVGKACGQDSRELRGLVDLLLRSVKFWYSSHQHNERPSSAKLFRQSLAPRDQFLGGDRSKFPAENPVLQVDQHERGRSRVKGNHRRDSSKAEGCGLRKMNL